MQRHEQRKIDLAIDAIAAGNYRGAVRDLCALIGRRDVPDVVNRKRSPGSIARSHGAATAHRARQAQPKPAKRHVDPDVLDAYFAAYPQCEVMGCGRPSQVHHIVKRSEHGDDDPANLLALCGGPDGHHAGRDGWHTRGATRWLLEFGPRLSLLTLMKVRTALRMDEATAEARG